MCIEASLHSIFYPSNISIERNFIILLLRRREVHLQFYRGIAKNFYNYKS